MRAKFRYEISPRPVELGGGVNLYLYGPDEETGEEISLGGGVFPSGPNKDEIDAATADAEFEAESWLLSRV